MRIQRGGGAPAPLLLVHEGREKKRWKKEEKNEEIVEEEEISPHSILLCIRHWCYRKCLASSGMRGVQIDGTLITDFILLYYIQNGEIRDRFYVLFV